jgi:hypothetical protein
MVTVVAPNLAIDGEDAPPEPRSDRAIPPHRRFAAAVLLAILVGLAVRVAIGLTDGAPATDETAYLRSGASLIDGDGFGREGVPEMHFPPLIPFLLGLGGRVFDDPHTGTVVLTTVTGTALIAPLALLGRRVGGTGAGIATAWVAALAPGVSTSLLNRGAGSEGVYILLVVSALWCVVWSADHRGWARVARVAAGGLLVGLAYLTRPEGLFVAAPLGLAVLALAQRGVGGRRRLVRTAGLAGAFAAPIIACIVPYAAYLHRHTGTWELSAKTQDASIEAWHAVARADREARDAVIYALDDTGLDLASPERKSLVTLAREDPDGYAAIVRTNLAELGEAIVNPESGQVLAWLLLPLPVWVLAAYGVWQYRRVQAMWVLLAVAAVPVAAIVVAFFVQPRYLMLTTALATVPAGAALASLRGRWRPAIGAAVVVLLVVSTVQGFEGAGGWWHPSDHTDQRAAGEWIAENTPEDARIMSRSMVVGYYADRQTMAIPYGSLDQIVTYGRHYGAQYIVVDWYSVQRLRPQLAPLREAKAAPGLRLVHEVRREGRTTSIFAFDGVTEVPAEIGAPLGFMGDG